MSSPLHLNVFVVPCKPIVGLTAPMGAGEATWPATSLFRDFDQGQGASS